MGCGCGGNCKSIQQQVINGDAGDNGLSAYEVWLEAGNTGSENVFLASLVGVNGLSAYQLAVNAGFVGDLAAWLASLDGNDGDPGDDGDDGQSAFTYTVALMAGFTMPAVGGSVSIQMLNTSWIAVEEPLFVTGAGTFLVNSIAGDVVSLRNPGVADGYTAAGILGNATPGSIVITTGGALITAGGRPGRQGIPGTSTPGPTGPTGSTGLPGIDGTQLLFLNADPNTQASTYGAPNGTLVFDTSVAGQTSWWKRTAPGVWVLQYTQVFSASPSTADFFSVNKNSSQPIPTGATAPIVVALTNYAPPNFNNGAWTGSNYVATGGAPGRQNFTLENLIISRPAGAGETIDFDVDIMQDSGGGGVSIANTTLSMASGDTSKSFAVLMKSGATIAPTNTVWVQVTPSANPTKTWSIGSGAKFYNQIAP
jgi:hypothetical protein